ncbi:MAG: CoA transferase [Solirubrobacterales bacterium]
MPIIAWNTHVGQEVEVSMFEALAGFVLGDHLYGEVFSPPEGEMGFPRHLAPHRKPFRTSDGYIGVMPYTDRQWSALFKAIGAPELCQDDRFGSVHARTAHIADLYAMVSDFLVMRSTEDWLKTFQAVDVPAMQTNTLEMLRDDPHLAAVGFFQEIEHPTEGRIWRMSPPVRWGRDTNGPAREAPRLGENSREILQELGFDQEQIQASLEAGVTALPQATDSYKRG